MTTNIDRAAEVIDALTKEGYELNSHVGNPHDIARRLDDAGLLMPDLPAPHAVEGDKNVYATEWRPNYSILRTDITG